MTLDIEELKLFHEQICKSSAKIKKSNKIFKSIFIVLSGEIKCESEINTSHLMAEF